MCDFREIYMVVRSPNKVMKCYGHIIMAYIIGPEQTGSCARHSWYRHIGV